MVGPPSNEDQRTAMNRLKLAIVLLVGVSAGLITFQGGGSLVQVAIAVVVGLGIGAVLLVYLTRIAT